MQGLSDEELVAVSRRDTETSRRREEAIDELLRRYQSRVAIWCLRVAGDREWAADLAQEVIFKAWRNLSTFRGESKFSTWLYTIARNHCFNAAQSRGLRPEEPLDDLDVFDSARRHDHQLEFEDEMTQARKLLSETLDDTERRVMTLHYGEEIPLDGITRLLGLRNTSGAKAYIVSGRRKLSAAVARLKAGAPGKTRASGLTGEK